MLEQAGEHAFDYTLHGGSPMRMQWHFFGRSELPVAVQTWELPPGGFEGMHAHGGDGMPLEEIYIVTEGAGTMAVEGEEYPVNAGDAILATAGSRHDVRNTGDGPLRLLVVWGQPRPSDYSGFGSATKARQARAASSPERTG